MKILGIDPSLNSTGICLNKKGKYTYFIIPSKMTRVMEKEDKILINYLPPYLNIPEETDEEILKSHKIHHISVMIDTLIRRIKPDLINIEGVSYGSVGSRALVDLAGLNFVIRSTIISHNIPFNIYPPTSWKKTMIGNGMATKDMIIDAWRRLENPPTLKAKIDDVADAYFLSRMGN